MNGKRAKQLRKKAYSYTMKYNPTFRGYSRMTNGQIVSDVFRQDYQNLKRMYVEGIIK